MIDVGIRETLQPVARDELQQALAVQDIEEHERPPSERTSSIDGW